MEVQEGLLEEARLGRSQARAMGGQQQQERGEGQHISAELAVPSFPSFCALASLPICGSVASRGDFRGWALGM